MPKTLSQDTDKKVLGDDGSIKENSKANQEILFAHLLKAKFNITNNNLLLDPIDKTKVLENYLFLAKDQKINVLFPKEKTYDNLADIAVQDKGIVFLFNETGHPAKMLGEVFANTMDPSSYDKADLAAKLMGTEAIKAEAMKAADSAKPKPE